MKLNLDCVRDVLLTVETMSDGRTQYILYNDEHIQDLIDESSTLQNYSISQVDYHFLQCIESGFLLGAEKSPGGFTFVDLSPSGHAFLNNIRDNKIWTSVKEKTEALETVSLNIISQVATALIKNSLGLGQ